MNTGFRNFSEEERDFVCEILRAKESDLSNLQVARFILKRLDFEGIYCNCNEGYVEILKQTDIDAANSYRTIVDICLFIEELEKSGYVTIDTVIGEKGTVDCSEEDSFWIYDHNKHTLLGKELLEKKGYMIAAKNYNIEIFHSQNLTRLLTKYVYNKIIIPRSPLVELKKAKFLSREEQQLNTMKGTLKVAISALAVSVVSLFVTVIMQKCCSTRIESQDLEIIAGNTNTLTEKMFIPSIDTIQLIDTVTQSNYDTNKMTNPS